MGNLDVLFADLLRGGDAQPVQPPGDIGDNGDNPRQCSRSGRFGRGDGVATSGDIPAATGLMSPLVARVSPDPNGPQTRANAHLSPESPMSPAPAGDEVSPAGLAWTGVEIESFTARHARLVGRGLTDDQAEALAERLVQRDREGDTRGLCIECSNFRAGRCRQAQRAGVGGPDVGALALMLQHCPAFGPIGGEPC